MGVGTREFSNKGIKNMKFNTIHQNASSYTVRELDMLDGYIWMVANENDIDALEAVDDKIAFYFDDEIFLKGSEEELRKIIADCT